jgi:AmmeMemoRadiSam system protein A
MNLSKEEQAELLRLARAAIAAVIGADATVRRPGAERSGLRTVLSGAFVSIHIGNDLRGCIGYPEADLPLASVVERCAASAATSDPRFPALTPLEWPRVTVEISVLGPLEAVADILDIEVGRHGLIAEMGRRSGLLLPQVATEWGWAREEFIAHTCVKAGLPKDAWQNGAKLFRFEAEVFGDS